MNFDPVSMPKVELHCHLDGSLSKEFLMQTLQLSTLDMHTIQAPANCQSLAEYLTCFDLPVSALQEKEHIRDAVVDVVRQAAAEMSAIWKSGCTYAERQQSPGSGKCRAGGCLWMPESI